MLTKTVLTAVFALFLALPASAQVRSARLTATTCPGVGCLLAPVEGFGSATVQLIFDGTATAVVEGSLDGRNWETIQASPAGSSTPVTSMTATGMWFVNVGGITQLRVRLSSITDPVVALIQATRSGGGASGGGSSGTEYTEGATDASITGTAMLWEDSGNTLRPVAAGTPLPVAIISGAGSGGTAATDDAAFTVATTSVTVAGCIEATDSMDAGDLGGVKCGADRELDIDVMSLPITFAAGAVAGTTPRVTLGSDDPAVASLATLDNIVSGAGINVTQLGGAAISMITTHASNIAYTQDALWVGAVLYCDSGTDIDLCPQSTAGAGVIDANTGRFTIATDDDLSDMATLLEANLVAHDAVDAGSPLKIGGRAVAFGSTPTAVAAADRADLLTNRAGIPFVQPGHPNIISTECQIQDADGALTDQACVSVSAGTKIVVTGVGVHCDGSTTAPTNIAVGFGTANVPARAHTGAAGVLLGFDGIAAGGGSNKGFAGGIVGVGADDEDVRYTTEDPAGGNCSVEVSYYTIAS